LVARADWGLWSDAETNESSDEVSSIPEFSVDALGSLDGVLVLLSPPTIRGGGKLGFE
jgi:hypothetical protein